MPYTRNKKGKNGYGLGTITSNHIPLAALQQILTFFPLQTSIPLSLRT